MDYKQINQIVAERGVKILWLSQQLGISQPYLSLILTGKRNMPKGMGDRIIKILSKPVL
jgi:DNA-binding Xre family transcriptional regulator